MYDNYIYGIFNQNSIQEQLQIQQQHNDQIWESIECAYKLDAFLRIQIKLNWNINSMHLDNVIGKHKEIFKGII